jgi:CRISPR-associated protein Cas5/CasD subtype I-E
MNEANTLFLRLEGPFQAWGDTSKFVIRRTMEAPTKSGVLGLVCCAMGLSREKARQRLPELNGLAMGARMDRPGIRWWDYHTVGAGTGLTTAGGGVKTGAHGTLITRREYLADASFLVALQGEAKLIEEVREALSSPKWPVFLGRKSCPPSVPVLARPREGEPRANPGSHEELNAALAAIPWRPRYKHEEAPRRGTVETLVEWRPAVEGDVAPDDAEVWYDAPVCFDPPVHESRFVLRGAMTVSIGDPIQQPTPTLPRPRADYRNAEYRKRREERIQADAGLCVFCKSPGPRMTVHHVTYRRDGGDETMEQLRSLCGLCHDAVTMLEYGLGMGMDRINPEDPHWRGAIIQKRAEILKFRSLEIRRRRLAAEEV